MWSHIHEIQCMLSCYDGMACVLFWIFKLENFEFKRERAIMNSVGPARRASCPFARTRNGNKTEKFSEEMFGNSVSWKMVRSIHDKHILPDIWELCPASLKTQFLKYFKLYAKRLETMDPQYRILPVHEAISTTVSVPGVVFEFNRRKAMLDKKLNISS